MSRDLLSRDEWLSGLLGFPAFHLRGAARSLGIGDLPKGRSFIDAKIPLHKIEEIRHLQKLGFYFVDVNMQMRRDAKPLSIATGICRFASSADEDQVRHIAAHSFSVSRFHLDANIPNETANRIKAEWAGNFFRGGRGDWMVVAEEEGAPAGFLQILKWDDKEFLIDLIAVSEESRVRGLGRAMIAFAGRYCFGKSAAMRVGTQAANINSLNFYSALGFSFISASYVLHLHTGV